MQACSPSAAYRLKKLIRRNKVGVFAGSAVVIALVAGLALAMAGFVQARRQAHVVAIREAAKATSISELLQSAIQSANPDRRRALITRCDSFWMIFPEVWLINWLVNPMLRRTSALQSVTLTADCPLLSRPRRI